MPDLPIDIPFVYSADIAYRGSSKRVMVASSLSTTLPLLDVPAKGPKPSAYHPASEQMRYRDGVGYTLLPDVLPTRILEIAAGSKDKTIDGRILAYELVGGVELFLHLHKAHGTYTLLTESDLASFDVVADTRDIVAARTLQLATHCFFDAKDPAADKRREIWGPMKSMFLGRTAYEAASKGAYAEVASFDRWRTQWAGDVRGYATDCMRLPRFMGLDRNFDGGAHGFKDEGKFNIVPVAGVDLGSPVPEAALNNLTFARMLRSVVVPRSIGRKLSSTTEEALASILSIADSYEDVLSRLPNTEETATTLRNCADVLTSRSSTLSMSLAGINTFGSDVAWFENYWKDRGPKLAELEADLPILGYRDEIAVPEVEPEAGYLSMGH